MPNEVMDLDIFDDIRPTVKLKTPKNNSNNDLEVRNQILEEENRIICDRISILENIIYGNIEIKESEIKKAVIVKMKKMNIKQAQIIINMFESHWPSVPVICIQQDMDIESLEDEDLLRMGLKRIN